MRRALVFVFATLFLFSAPLAAQEVEHPGPDAVDVPAEQVGTTVLPSAEALDAGEIQFQQVETVDQVDATAIQPDNRSWWWLVGGIVVAGLILALLIG